MRKAIAVVTVLLCLVFLAGCNLNFDEEKDLQLGKMEEQIKTLRLENARLKKEIVKTDINDTGTGLTFVTAAGIFIVGNNLIWWVIARRRRNEDTETV